MEQLFKMALGLGDQWILDKVEFVPEGSSRVLHLHLSHAKGVRFTHQGKEHPIYDHQTRKWRHLDFFQHECFLHAEVPRVKTEEGNTELVDVPWADKHSSFTLLFSAYALMLIKGGMSLKSAGELMSIDGRRISTVIKQRVAQALCEGSLEDIDQLGVDETSSRKGHNYLTILTDLVKKKVVGIGIGKSSESMVEGLAEAFFRGADTDKVKVVSMDMSRAYISASAQYLPEAEVVFDRFHIEQGMNRVVDQTRRAETKKYHELKNSRYLWLRNFDKLDQEMQYKVQELSTSYPTLGEVHRLKEQLKTIFNDYKDGPARLKQWIQVATKRCIPRVDAYIRTLQSHWKGIVAYFRYKVTNAYAERVNLKIQEIKRSAKGYRNIENFKFMIYFHLGKLDLGLPTKIC
jgi:transposase